jgi:hypothetical protein
VQWAEDVLSQDVSYLSLTASAEFHSPVRRFLASSPWASTFKDSKQKVKTGKLLKGWGLLKGQVQGNQCEIEHNNEVEKNQFICETVYILLDMVKHGFLRTRLKCAQLMDTLLRFLQKAKAPAEAYTSSMDEDVIIVTRTKRGVCAVLAALHRIWINDAFVAPLLTTFVDVQGSTFLQHSTFDDVLLKHPVTIAKREAFLWFRQLGNETELESPEFVDLLLSLSQYKDVDLTNGALDLLRITFDARASVVALLHSVTITADPDGINSLRDLRQFKMKWAEIQHDSQASAFIQLSPIVERYCEQMSVHLGMLQVYTNQVMMCNEGVHELVLRLVAEHIRLQNEVAVRKECEDRTFKALFVHCFRFLSLFAVENVENQKVLASKETIELLVYCCRFGLGAERVLAAIMTNPAVEPYMNQDTIKRLVNNMFHHSKCRTALYLKMLAIAIAPKGHTSEEKQTQFVELLLHVGLNHGSCQYDEVESHAPGLELLLCKLMEDHVASNDAATHRDRVLTMIGPEKGDWLRYVVQVQREQTPHKRASKPSRTSSIDFDMVGFPKSRPSTAAPLFDDGAEHVAADFCIELADIFRICSEANVYARGLLSHEAPFAAALYPLVDTNITMLSPSQRSVYAGLADALHFPQLDGSEQSARCAFSDRIYNRGCHWIPRMFA